MTGKPDAKSKQVKAEERRKQEAELDAALEDTFPASDPVSLTSPEVGPGAPSDHAQDPPAKRKKR